MLNSYDMPIAGYSNSDKTAFKYFKGGDKFHYVFPDFNHPSRYSQWIIEVRIKLRNIKKKKLVFEQRRVVPVINFENNISCIGKKNR